MSDNSTTELESNWNLFRKICENTGERADALISLVDTLGERLILCPARDKSEWTTCKPGGLIENSLRVFKLVRKLNDTLSLECSLESMIVTSLFCEIGKVGDLEGNDYFLNQDSDWHREKLGQYYKYNPVLQKMPHSHRSLQILQSAGVTLTQDEWIAIATAGGQNLEENKFYSGAEPSLSVLLQMGIRAANLQSWKGNT